MKLTNEVGNKYGKLLVIERAENYGTLARWKCICDCGNTCIVKGSELRNKRVKACGCRRALKFGEASFNSAYSAMKFSATQKRKKNWTLTKEQVREIITSACYYCGAKPSQVSKGGTKPNGVFIHNGIDRLDSDIGYEFENCVPCCKRCNFAKHIMSVDEFKEWIISIYTHFIT